MTTLDGSALIRVTSVGHSFLRECRGLITLRLSGALLQHGSVLDTHKRLLAQ